LRQRQTAVAGHGDDPGSSTGDGRSGGCPLKHLRSALQQNIKKIHGNNPPKLHIGQTSTKRVMPRLTNWMTLAMITYETCSRIVALQASIVRRN
jgi:hypothetical protein